MSIPNPKDFRPPESVTPLKRRAQDGIVYERTGEKRLPKRGELIWHDGTFSAPYPYDSERDGPIITPIWKVSEDQNWQPPEVKSSPENEIDRLIQEIGFGLTEEYGKYLALGSLHQAKQLERIANALDSLCAGGSIPEGLRGIGSREFFVPRLATNADLSSVGVYVCTNCQHEEHSACLSPSECHCVSCNQAPQQPDQISPSNMSYGALMEYYGLHPFEGMEDNHFCTKCGAGRLHEIHQG